MEFHGIPWNLECANFADTSSSMEKTWNSMKLEVRQFRWHEKFHAIPWNLECANFADTSSSMEFNVIPWNLECANFADTSSSMEFHGIPWNLECANFADEQFHGIPWNSIELRMRQFRWHEKFHVFQVRQFRWREQFHGIPWNLGCANFDDTSSSMHINFYISKVKIIMSFWYHSCSILAQHIAAAVGLMSIRCSLAIWDTTMTSFILDMDKHSTPCYKLCILLI